MEDELFERKDPMWATLAEATIEPVRPPAGLRDRLMERIRTGPRAEQRHGEERWRPTEFAGVSICHLHHDPATGLRTYYLRMEPGAKIPAHRHGADEQCLVVKGDLSWGGLTYAAGDFFVTGQGSEHPVSRTAQGNVLLIIAGQNEYGLATV